MATLNIHSGDFRSGSFHEGGSSSRPRFRLNAKDADSLRDEEIDISQLAELDVVKRETTHGIGKKLTRVLAGGAIGGPVGLMTGAMMAATQRNDQSVIFEARFRDGRRMLASTDRKTFLAIQAAKANSSLLNGGPGPAGATQAAANEPVDIPWAPDFLKEKPAEPTGTSGIDMPPQATSPAPADQHRPALTGAQPDMPPSEPVPAPPRIKQPHLQLHPPKRPVFGKRVR